MAEKKSKAKKTTTKAKSKAKKTTTKAKTRKKSKNEQYSDPAIVVIDDDFSVNEESIHEERRAYLEEARSQEASD